MIPTIRALTVALIFPLGLWGAGFEAAPVANQLGLDLYRQVAKDDPSSNLILSPYSISSALALAYTGADGATRTEMARVLHFPADDSSLQASLAALRAALEKMAADSAKVAERDRRWGGSIEWHVANRLFGQSGYAFHEAFLNRMKDGYGAPFEALDFRHGADAARVTINRWVEEQTRERIYELIPEDGVDASTRLVLANAVYLKAPWSRPFNAGLTKNLPFFVPGNEETTVRTMCMDSHLAYRHADGFTTVVLPYIGEVLQFVIFLPDQPDGVDQLAARLTPDDLSSASRLGAKSHAHVRLFLPKLFLAGDTIRLGHALQALGMKQAFDLPSDSADFSRIAPRQPHDYLAISEVFHQTFLTVDEKGTEAAAATAIGMRTLGASLTPPKPIEVRVDHPFLFAIQHRKTGLCLFFGRISDPR